MMDDELKRLLEAMRQENTAAHTDTRRHVDVVAEDTRRHIDVVGQETRRHFDVVAEDLRNDVKAVAEGVLANTQQIDSLRSEMDEQFSEVKSMIKFSHAELDRRVRTLEETQRKLEDAVSDLQARVERLESPTH
jgi:predicted  nucleic acid-binding Zn-ribbon protein